MSDDDVAPKSFDELVSKASDLFERRLAETVARQPQKSVWVRDYTGFSWQARPAFFSVFWKSEWR